MADFDRWREACDDDPVGRERGRAHGYQIMRSREDPNYALIDLEFDTVQCAGEFLAQLRRLWDRVDVIRDPSARIVELVEERSPLASVERA